MVTRDVGNTQRPYTRFVNRTGTLNYLVDVKKVQICLHKSLCGEQVVKNHEGTMSTKTVRTNQKSILAPP